jgi:hypothetical protein
VIEEDLFEVVWQKTAHDVVRFFGIGMLTKHEVRFKQHLIQLVRTADQQELLPEDFNNDAGVKALEALHATVNTPWRWEAAPDIATCLTGVAVEWQALAITVFARYVAQDET